MDAGGGALDRGGQDEEEKGRRRARYHLVATDDDELYAWGYTGEGWRGLRSVHVQFHSYRSGKMVNVQVVCANVLARILTSLWPLDKTKTSNNMWKNCVPKHSTNVQNV
jgi:hypothetical protein